MYNAKKSYREWMRRGGRASFTIRRYLMMMQPEQARIQAKRKKGEKYKVNKGLEKSE